MTEKEDCKRHFQSIAKKRNLTLKKIDMITAGDVILHDPDGNVEFHFVWILFIAKALTDDIRHETPEVEAKWFKLNELPTDEMPPEVLDFVLSMSERIQRM